MSNYFIGPEDPPDSVHPDPDNNMLNTVGDDGYSFDEKDDEPSSDED